MIAASGRARLAYDITGGGRGAGVLLLHAGVNDRRSWRQAAALAVADAAGLERPVVVACSMGGQVTLDHIAAFVDEHA